MHDWHSFIYTADEWFVNYACTPVESSSVTIFSVGHSVELYLKGTYTKNTTKINEAIKYGHDIKNLWDACKSHDSNFMPNYQIRDSVFSVDFLDSHVVETLDRDDRLHYVANQTLYIIAKHLKDLKYFRLPWKTRQGPLAMAHIHPDPYWIEFFREMRAYFQYPPKNKRDFLKEQLDKGRLPFRGVEYLRELYV